MSSAYRLDRAAFIDHLVTTPEWDMIIIGGGATGLGIAVDAASRGYSVLLLEQADFAKGTSSRSTKLVHGGVRYLAQGNISLVYDALHERGLLLKNAAHLVRSQRFIIPCYNRFAVLKYWIGLKLYDWLAGRYSFGKSRYLSAKKLVSRLPAIQPEKLLGGIEYFDGQFDDARLAINLATTAAEQGASVLNYCKVMQLHKKEQRVSGVTAVDLQTGQSYVLQAKAVINATGVFVDDILQMDQPGSRPLVRPSQGVHVMLDASFLPGTDALMIPQTTDGRVLFAVPWHGHILAGTTDTPLNSHSLEPVAQEQEINFILSTLQQYITRLPARKDVLSVFAGLRPLAAPQKDTGNTKEISRDHKLLVSASGLITITGGKWTTYRKMAEDTVNKAMVVAGLPDVACKTREIAIHGCTTNDPADDSLVIYGTDAGAIKALIQATPALQQRLVAHLPYTEAEVVWTVRNEMPQTIEDVLARRLRLLFLDARAALLAAPRVAALMAIEQQRDAAWQYQQLEAFKELAGQYLLPDKPL